MDNILLETGLMIEDFFENNLSIQIEDDDHL